jgi:hypothetical protein
MPVGEQLLREPRLAADVTGMEETRYPQSRKVL